jgi:phosphatidylethanolamine/phosphatidyl-N-methylethanolamine N-methyltransferase
MMRDRNLSLAELVGDEVRFVTRWVTNRKAIGAVSPSSRALARLMVEHADPDPSGYTLELGPGTGVFTQALIDAGIPADRIIAVEHNREFCRLLSKRFPALNVVEGDAFDLDNTLADYAGVQFSAALSGLPLLSFPRHLRLKCIEGVLDRLLPGKGLVQFSYGPHGPLLPIPGRIAATKSKWVLMNLPPARVWTYTRP